MVTAWLVALTIGLPWLGAVSIWLIGNKSPRVPAVSGNRRIFEINALAVGASILAGVAALALLPFSASSVALRLTLGGALAVASQLQAQVFGDFTFVADGMGILLAVIATVIGSLTIIFSIDYMRGEAQLNRYYALVLLFIGGMAGLVLTSSLLLLFFFWELVAFCSYALISFHNDDPKAVAGGIKALVMTQVGGAGLLVGALLVYSYLGSYDINNFLSAARAHTFPPALLSVVAFGFLIGAAAKSAQVPFHTWLPDAMEAPTPVSALIHAATMVNAGVYLLARFYPAFAQVPGWSTAVIVVAVLSVILPGLMACVANDIKRVLAYSTISQLGYMVYAVGVGAVFASQFHLLSHALFKALLFLAAGAVIHTTGTRDLRKMGGLSNQMPFVRNAFVIGALALAGLPILNGFWSKELILEAGLDQGPAWAYELMLIGVGITALYTLRVVWLAFFGAPHGVCASHGARAQTNAPAAMRISLMLLASATLTSWLLASPLARLLQGTLPPLGGLQPPRDVPFHNLVGLPITEFVIEILSAPTTAVALSITLLGAAAWWWRERLNGVTSRLQFVSDAASNSFGFEWLNREIASATRGAADLLRKTQTGQLNWNVVGIVGGLIVVVAVLVWGS